MKRLFGRVVFAAIVLAVIIRLGLPIVTAGDGTLLHELLYSRLPVPICFLFGVGVSLVCGRFLNFTDFARYTWPINILLRRIATRSQLVALIYRKGAARWLSPSSKKKALCIVTSTLAGSIVFSVYLESLTGSWNPIVTGVVDFFSFAIGLVQGMVSDILLPRHRQAVIGLAEKLGEVPQPMRQEEVESLYRSHANKNGDLVNREAYEAEITGRGGKRIVSQGCEFCSKGLGAEQEIVDFMKEEGFAVLREPRWDHEQSRAPGLLVFPPRRIFVITTENVNEFLEKYEVFYGFIDNAKLLVSTSNPEILTMVKTLGAGGEKISLVQNLAAVRNR